MDEQADRRAREHQQMDTWKYYDALSLSLSPLAMVLSEAVTSALGRARTHLHTHTLTRRGCTYTALLCNDDYFCPLSLSSTHIPTPMHLSPPPGMAVSWLRTRPRPSDRFIHRLELLHWRSCLTQTREEKRKKEWHEEGGEGNQKALSCECDDGGEFVRSPEFRRWLVGNGGSASAPRAYLEMALDVG